MKAVGYLPRGFFDLHPHDFDGVSMVASRCTSQRNMRPLETHRFQGVFAGADDGARTRALILTNARFDVISGDFESHSSPRILVFQGFRDTPFCTLTTPLRYPVAVVLASCGICCGTDAVGLDTFKTGHIACYEMQLHSLHSQTDIYTKS